MDETNGVNEERDTNFYPLDEAAISVFADIKQEMHKLDGKATGALMLFIRQHKLPGVWRLAENGRELQRIPDPVSSLSSQ